MGSPSFTEIVVIALVWPNVVPYGAPTLGVGWALR